MMHIYMKGAIVATWCSQRKILPSHTTKRPGQNMLSAEEEAREGGSHQIIQSVSPQHDVDGDECLLITEMREGGED